MLIERINITADPGEAEDWPFTVPAVRQVADAGLVLKNPLTFLEFVSSFNIIVPGYPQEDLRSLSHGEGYLAVFREVFSRPGLYLLDEPEAALSFSSSLQLVDALHSSLGTGAQVICATHSPIVASTPGADILELSDAGIRRTAWDDLELAGRWRQYLNHPESYLRHLLAE